MYGDSNTSFQVANFLEFIHVIANASRRIRQDLNDGTKYMAFRIMGQSHMVHYIDPLTGLHFPIACVTPKTTIIVMKTQCIFACDLLLIKSKCKFSNHELMNTLGVIIHNTSYNQFVSSFFQLI